MLPWAGRGRAAPGQPPRKRGRPSKIAHAEYVAFADELVDADLANEEVAGQLEQAGLSDLFALDDFVENDDKLKRMRTKRARGVNFRLAKLNGL